MRNALTLSSSTVAAIQNSSHIVVEFPTSRRLSSSESEQLCDQVEAAFLRQGVSVRAAGGTNYGSSIAIDVYKQVSK